MSFTLLVQGQRLSLPMIYSSPSTHLDPPSCQAHFLMNTLGWGMSTMETAGHPGIGACRLPPGPLHSRGLSVKAENFPLKLCQLSGVFHCPNLGPHHLHPTPSGLHTSIPLFLPCALLLSLCRFLPSLVTPSWNPPSAVPKKLSPYPPLSPSQAMQSKNWTWKKKSGTERA